MWLKEKNRFCSFIINSFRVYKMTLFRWRKNTVPYFLRYCIFFFRSEEGHIFFIELYFLQYCIFYSTVYFYSTTFFYSTISFLQYCIFLRFYIFYSTVFFTPSEEDYFYSTAFFFFFIWKGSFYRPEMNLHKIE